MSLEAVSKTESSNCMQHEPEAGTHGSESLDGEKTPGPDHAPCPTAQKDGNLADEVSSLFLLSIEKWTGVYIVDLLFFFLRLHFHFSKQPYGTPIHPHHHNIFHNTYPCK